MVLLALYCYTVPVQVHGIDVMGVVDMVLSSHYSLEEDISDAPRSRKRREKGKGIKTRRNRKIVRRGFCASLNKEGGKISVLDGNRLSLDSRVWQETVDAAKKFLSIRHKQTRKWKIKGSNQWERDYGERVADIKDSTSPYFIGRSIFESIANNEIDDRHFFPPKEHPAARTKINVYVADVFRDIRRFYYPQWCDLCDRASALLGTTNDEAAGWSMWYVLCRKAYPEMADKVFAMRKNKEAIKELSTMVKSLGLNSTHQGSMITELTTLLGRNISEGNTWEDIRTRVNKRAFYAEKAAVVDLQELEKALKQVYNEEVTVQPRWLSKEDYWTQRWLTTKSGSHTRRIEDLVFGERLDLPPQPTRREFAEACDKNLVALGEPRVDAGISWKLEHSKSRAIYGCDSRSYFTFDYLLRPIEKVWKNKRTLLSPGQIPQFQLYPKLAKRNECSYMLDFDDYNSQHTLDAMALVCKVFLRDAPEDVRDWAIESWYNQYVHWMEDGEAREEKIVGTLFSGHRATTFINTVLNAAYCRLACGPLYDEIDAVHAGDDVYMSGSATDLHEVVQRVEKSPFRVNRSKQSFGRVCGEFLRVAFNSKEAHGYLARAIASVVSGSWVSDRELSTRSYIDNYTRMGWTIMNRSRDALAGSLLFSSFCRRVPTLTVYAREICCCKFSVNGSPIHTDIMDGWFEIEVKGGVDATRVNTTGRPSFATQSYLDNHVDHGALKEMGVSAGQLRAAMLKSSYKPRGDTDSTNITFKSHHLGMAVPLGTESAVLLPMRGELQIPAALQILRNMFDGNQWRRFAEQLSLGTGESGKIITHDYAVGCQLGLGYSDLSTMKKRLTRNTWIRPLYRLYV